MIRILFSLFVISSVSAQTVSSVYLSSGLEIPLYTFEKPSDIDQLIQEDEKNEGFYRFGKLVYTSLSTTNSGQWYEVDSGKVWTLAIEAKEAKGISLYYDDFWIPTGGELVIYNPNQTQKIGPFTSKDNHSSRVFANELIYDDILILEYYHPNTATSTVSLNINRFAYAYRDISGGQLNGFGSSDNCQVNANCSEGDAWEFQKESACRIQIQDGFFSGICSGAMINNTLNDCSPYVLSADHCFSGDGASENDLNQTIFYFNYRSSGCNNSTPNNTHTITGCQKLSNSSGEGNNGDSDFYLVELNSEPDFDPYYAGWDRSNTPASSGVSIHHPSGDIMKISTFNNSLYSDGGLGFGNDNTTHWGVVWSSTNNGHGVTEGGSSGSPIFNQNKLIVGHLTGGSSYCNATSSPDVYGKVWHAWDQMGNTSGRQLQPWLDPTNSGVTTLNGIYCGQSSQVVAAFSSSETIVCRNSTVTFNSISSGNINSYEWQFPSGSPSTATGPGPHTITYSDFGTHNVSLEVSGDDNSDTYTQTDFITVGPNEVELDFLPDCYGSEISWDLNNAQGQTIFAVNTGYYPGGNNANDMEQNPVAVQEDWCLSNGCYTFTVYDEYGDGLYGSQHTCEFNGDFSIYDASGNVLTSLESPNADFGEEISLEFCVESSVSILEKSNKVKVFPNPSYGVVTLSAPTRGEVIIYNTLSSEVYRAMKSTNDLQLDLSKLDKGIYFINFNNSVNKLILN
ncbi:MAG: PKD domain-containing protein [Flavobacteriales bacterium]